MVPWSASLQFVVPHLPPSRQSPRLDKWAVRGKCQVSLMMVHYLPALLLSVWGTFEMHILEGYGYHHRNIPALAI